jgi:hypothetical protein
VREYDGGSDPDQNDIWTIFKIWWDDLLWTWTYQIHPFLKFCFFTVIDWCRNLCATICGWWNELFA